MGSTMSNVNKNLRPISLWDRVRALFCSSPSSGDRYCEIYDQWVNERLNTITSVSRIDMHRLSINTEKGPLHLWVSNYPYSYGGPFIGEHRKFLHALPSWSTVLRIREIQLKYNEQVIKEFVCEKLAEK